FLLDILVKSRSVATTETLAYLYDKRPDGASGAAHAGQRSSLVALLHNRVSTSAVPAVRHAGTVRLFAEATYALSTPDFSTGKIEYPVWQIVKETRVTV